MPPKVQQGPTASAPEQAKAPSVGKLLSNAGLLATLRVEVLGKLLSKLEH